MHARISALLLLLVLAFTGLAAAQETTGAIGGRLLDAQGLAIPGATVTVTGPQGARERNRPQFANLDDPAGSSARACLLELLTAAVRQQPKPVKLRSCISHVMVVVHVRRRRDNQRDGSRFKCCIEVG